MIKHCILLGDRGYPKALEILKERYGNPTEIARGYINNLVKGPVLKIGDTKALVALSDEMLGCETVLTSMGFVSDLNSAHTMEAIVARLPRQFGSKWAERAYDLGLNRREPRFKDLREFVSKKAHVAMSRYGVVVNENAWFVPYTRGSGRPQQKSSRSVFVNQESEPDDCVQDSQMCFGAEAARSIKCVKCSGDHFVTNCQEFKDMPCDNKVNFIRQNNMCFNCLWKGHRSSDCRKPPQCGECTSKHNALIHIDRPSQGGSVSVDHGSSGANVDVKSSTNDVSVNNVNVQSQKVCLRILPVVVHGKDVEIETYALLDEGSQVTLCDEKLFERLNLPSIDTTLNVNTVNQNVTHGCKETSFVVSSLDGANSVSIDRAFAIADLPVSLEGLPEAGMCKVYPHLKGVDVPRVECDSVQLIIGCNVPDVFHVLDERIGQTNEPIAKLSKLGWTTLGPIGAADMEPVREFLHVCPAQVESENDPVERMQTIEFADLVVDDRKSVNVIDSIDTFRSSLNQTRDRCSKYTLLFVMVILSCWFCAMNFQVNQEKQEYCVAREFSFSVHLLEAERIVNGRPLTPISSDPTDLEVLTPNKVLLLRGNAALSPGVFCQRTLIYESDIDNRNDLPMCSGKDFRQEYIPLLQARSKWIFVQRSICVGDVVLVVDELLPRGQWPLGLIVDVHKSRDGLVRSVYVRYNDAVKERPVAKLCLLEAACDVKGRMSHVCVVSRMYVVIMHNIIGLWLNGLTKCRAV